MINSMNISNNASNIITNSNAIISNAMAGGDPAAIAMLQQGITDNTNKIT